MTAPHGHHFPGMGINAWTRCAEAGCEVRYAEARALWAAQRRAAAVGADGYMPSPDRNLIAEKRARLDVPKRSRGRKSGDPREDRARADARRAARGL